MRAVLGIGAIVIALVGLRFATVPLGDPTVGTVGPRDASDSVERPIQGIEIGEAAPEFVDAESGDALLVDLDGRPVRLGDLAGTAVWIVFWATWCTPCQQEAGEILALFHAHATDDLAVLAIDVQEPAVAVRRYALDHGLDYAIGLDPAAAVKTMYGGVGLPTHLFLDRDHVIRDRYIGQMTRDLMEQHLQAILR